MLTAGKILLGVGIIGVYIIPIILGYGKKNFNGILLLNLLLGWTILGWIGALIWAVSSPHAELPGWIYTCPKCGYKNSLNQKVKLYVCPQCKNEIKCEL